MPLGIPWGRQPRFIVTDHPERRYDSRWAVQAGGPSELLRLRVIAWEWFVGKLKFRKHTAMMDYKYIALREEGDVTVVDVANPRLLDRLLIYELGDELITFVEAKKPEKLLISFGRVSYCSSEVIGSLIRARARVVTDGGCLKLCSMNRDVQQLFEITNLDGTIFDIYDTEDEALAAF